MHELSITNDILRAVLRHAKRERATRVHRILLVVTEISDLQPMWLQHYFTRIARDTVAAAATLEVERQAPSFTCNNCGKGFAVSLMTVDQVHCTACGSSDCVMTSEPDYMLEEIEVS